MLCVILSIGIDSLPLRKRDGDIYVGGAKCSAMTDTSSEDIEIPPSTQRRVRERVLKAEKEKLNLDLPRGINDEIEQIIRDEISE